MRYRIDSDPFEKQQPPIGFRPLLSDPLHEKKLHRWNLRQAAPGEVSIRAARLCPGFPDPEGSLATAYEDFADFLHCAQIAPDGDFCLRTACVPAMQHESYTITTTEHECLITAGDADGVRRALYFIEDEMHRREGSFLPLGTISRHAVIHTRISRGFLNPHYCPGCDGELEDDTEYYPDGYLNRLAHDGVNAIWVQERLRVIVPSDIIPEYAADAQKREVRVARLNRLIERCRRYGIRVYLEGIEPASTLQNPDLKNHPELWGQAFGEEHTFCPSTEKGRAYIRESMGRLFTLCPDLAGIVNISVGEAISHCASLDDPLTCPHCLALGLTKAQVLDNCEREILAGMRAVKPDAELISWAYAMRVWEQADWEAYFRDRNPDTVSMINFEDLGEVEQAGKIRTAMDYWLSYPGPGKIFQCAAESDNPAPVFAKLQVSTSHEISSVPYVPVPGILYDKYRYMHEHGVTGVMYCWYFGNYPSMMNKAAGELAFAPFYEDKDAFLEHIAGIYWGSDAKTAAQAYRKFEDGYKNYPVSMTFEWHGPMGDAPVWPLHLEPVDLPVSRSYKLMNMVGSDRLGETMLMGHSFADVLILCREMRDRWREGVTMLAALDGCGDVPREEQQIVAEAIDILFASGYNIFRFYDLRSRLGFLQGDPAALLCDLRAIVEEERRYSARLITLCEADPRLGYHCEAMGFKFFPEKLQWRMGLLDELLAREFPAVEARIRRGETPLPFYFGRAPESHRYLLRSPADAQWEPFMDSEGAALLHTQIRVSADDESIHITIRQTDPCDLRIDPEFEMFHPYVPLLLRENGLALHDAASYGLFGDEQKQELAKWNLETTANDGWVQRTLTISRADLFPDGVKPFRMAVAAADGRAFWQRGDRFYYRLIFGTFSPDSQVFIIPETHENL